MFKQYKNHHVHLYQPYTFAYLEEEARGSNWGIKFAFMRKEIPIYPSRALGTYELTEWSAFFSNTDQVKDRRCPKSTEILRVQLLSITFDFHTHSM